MLDNEFDLEKGYQSYLKMMELDEAKMPKAQKRETKRAFYGGITCMLGLATQLDGIAEDDAIKMLEKLNSDIGAFWISEIANNKN